MFPAFHSLTGRLRNNYLARSMAVLVGGAASAHAITALALPVLSRLYTPEDFSAMAVFNSMFTVLTVAACLRYDISVPLPVKDSDGLCLVTLAIGIAGAVCLALLVLVLLLPTEIARLVDQPALSGYLWLLAPGVFLAASASAMQNWFVRTRGYGMIARSRIAQSGGAVALQFGAAAVNAGPIGLVLGAIFNTGGAALILGGKMATSGLARIHSVSWPRIRAVAREYKDFPRYSALEALCNMASLQVPVILISSLAVGPEPGYVLLAISVLQAPMALFGIAIGQIYLSHAPDEYRQGNLAKFTIDTTNMLIRSGVGPLIAGGLAAPFVFGFVFGNGWERAGMILAWMTPWFVMQFLTSPISMALIVTGHQRRGLALQAFSLLCRVGAVYLAWLVDPRFITEAYAFSGFVTYFVYYLIVMHTIDAPVLALGRGLLAHFRIMGAWILLALLAVGAFRVAYHLIETV